MSERAEGLDIALLTTDRVAFARIAGELDAATAPDLITTVQRLLAAGSRDVVLDCGSLTFCDSAGLRALLVIRRAQPDGATLSLVRPRSGLRRLLAVTGIGDQLVIS